MIKIIGIRGVIGISALGMMLLSCNRPKDIIGEPYFAAPKDFYVIDDKFNVNPKEVNFETQKDSFAFKLSHRVNWYINIRGLESGATKSFAGSSKELSFGELVWNGGHFQDLANNKLTFFKKGENAVVELSFLGSPLLYSDTVKILKAYAFDSPGTIIIADDASQLSEAGFEGTYKFVSNPEWSFGPYFDRNEKTLADLDTTMPQIQGRRSFTLEGTDLNKSYFIGGIKRVLSRNEIAKLPVSSDGVYVNIFIYGLGDANSKLNFSFEEDDNGNGVHNPALDDAFERQFSLDHKGWKLFSVKYSELNRAANPLFGGNGNNIKEPSKLKAVAFNLVSGEPGKTAKATFDFPTITIGGPFDPNK